MFRQNPSVLNVGLWLQTAVIRPTLKFHEDRTRRTPLDPEDTPRAAREATLISPTRSWPRSSADPTKKIRRSPEVLFSEAQRQNPAAAAPWSPVLFYEALKNSRCPEVLFCEEPWRSPMTRLEEPWSSAAVLFVEVPWSSAAVFFVEVPWSSAAVLFVEVPRWPAVLFCEVPRWSAASSAKFPEVPPKSSSAKFPEAPPMSSSLKFPEVPFSAALQSAEASASLKTAWSPQKFLKRISGNPWSPYECGVPRKWFVTQKSRQSSRTLLSAFAWAEWNESLWSR